MNHHCAKVELLAESVVSTAELNQLSSIYTSCCYRAAAELNSSYLVRHGNSTRMNWA